MENLKGTLAERVRDLRRERNLSQQELGDVFGIDKGTISKIENGKTINSDLALSFAEYFGVSLDYLFGLSDDRSSVNYDLKKLGISSAAAEKLCSEEVDADIVNMLIEHPDFGNFSIALALYFTDAVTAGACIQNTIFDEVSRIVGYMRNDHSEEAAHDIQTVKYPHTDFDLTAIQNMFSNMIIDIKSGMKSNTKKEEKNTREIVRALEQSVGKHNLAIRRINAGRLASGVVEAIASRHYLTEEMRSNLVAAFIPLFANDVKKGQN
ncbi:MAG: helix-turn-helix transcriptional regulator [Clostridia bacterium]|nr:helix-turn-helix transcriptional regulator [Clostridia bacterium]